jgi:hypothetical protein
VRQGSGVDGSRRRAPTPRRAPNRAPSPTISMRAVGEGGALCSAHPVLSPARRSSRGAAARASRSRAGRGRATTVTRDHTTTVASIVEEGGRG